MAQRELVELSPQECFALLRRARVGRLLYEDAFGPVGVPVNYAMAGNNIIFRVEGGAKRAAMKQLTLAFEVDHIDEDRRTGWSVLVRGAGHEIPVERVPELLRRMRGHFPAPWAAGVHNVWLELRPNVVTGRRLGAHRITVS